MDVQEAFIPSISTIYETLLSRISVKSPEIHIIDWLENGMCRTRFKW